MSSVFEEPLEGNQAEPAKPAKAKPDTTKTGAAGAARPQARIIKRNQSNAGVVGNFRVPCAECDDTVAVKQIPNLDQEVLCVVCAKILKHGKPSTRKVKKGARYDYVTHCDKCGRDQETPFLPKAGRPFLCDRCHRQEPQRHTGPLKRGVEVLGSKQEPLYMVPCDTCEKKVQVKFAPRAKEPFYCPDCFGTRPQRKKPPEKKTNTRVMFQIECAGCGKNETVDFIPSSLATPLCSQCFEERKHKKRKPR